MAAGLPKSYPESQSPILSKERMGFFVRVNFRQKLLNRPFDSLKQSKNRNRIKIEKIERVPNNPKRIKLTLKGFNLREIQSTIAGKPATTVSIDEANNLLTLEAEAEIKTNDKIRITSADEQLEAEMKAP